MCRYRAPSPWLSDDHRSRAVICIAALSRVPHLEAVALRCTYVVRKFSFVVSVMIHDSRHGAPRWVCGLRVASLGSVSFVGSLRFVRRRFVLYSSCCVVVSL